jgi:hypothetical protein
VPDRDSIAYAEGSAELLADPEALVAHLPSKKKV